MVETWSSENTFFVVSSPFEVGSLSKYGGGSMRHLCSYCVIQWIHEFRSLNCVVLQREKGREREKVNKEETEC